MITQLDKCTVTSRLAGISMAFVFSSKPGESAMRPLPRLPRPLHAVPLLAGFHIQPMPEAQR
jgi:hypothetical protein